MSKTCEQTVRVLDEAYKTIRSGAPGLSDQTCNVLAGIIARKVSIVYAQPQPSQQAGPHCQLCGGNVEGWTCQTCEAEFEEVDSLLVLKTEKPSQQADTLDATVSRIKTLANDSQQAGAEPTMFWDADDWENGGCDPADIVENYAPGEVVKLDTAIQGPPRWGVMSPEHEVRIFTTADEAEAWFLAALKPVEG